MKRVAKPSTVAAVSAAIVLVAVPGPIAVAGSAVAGPGATTSKAATLDPAFRQVGAGFDGQVNDLAVQPDGKIVVVGNFDHYGTAVRNGIARLNSDGSLDTTFTSGSGFVSAVGAVAIQRDGTIYVGGSFGSYRGKTANRIVRLLPNGAFDSSFKTGSGFAGFPAMINQVIPLSNGKVLAGGNFSSFNGQSRVGLVRLQEDGKLDQSFVQTGTGFNGAVVDFTVQPDGKIVATGTFTAYDASAHANVARLLPNGKLDIPYNLNSGGNDQGISIAQAPGGKVYVGGYFANFDGLPRNYVARLTSTGALDKAFVPQFPSVGGTTPVTGVAVQKDGNLLAIGQFANYGTADRSGIVRITPSGSVDSSFKPGTGFNVGPLNNMTRIALQPDGKILVAGSFTRYNGVARTGVVRLLGTPATTPQFPVGCGAFPAQIKADATTVILPKRCLTNAWRPLQVSAQQVVLPRGDVRLFRLIRTAGGRVSIQTFGDRPFLVKITMTAPAGGGYSAYRNSRTYRVQQ